MSKSSRAAIVLIAAMMALTGCAQSTEQTTITDQAAQIATLTETNAAITQRLDVCIASAVRYREFAVENEALMQGISDEWGVNYRTPVRDVMVAFKSAATMLKCD